MKTALALFPLLLGVSLPQPASRAPAHLAFTSSGFSIDSLDDDGSAQLVQVVTLMLPATQGFAPNVNVQIQHFEGTIDEYTQMSKRQFAGFGAKMVAEKKAGDGVLIEYTAEMQGSRLHFYAKILQAGEKIYLATGTATEAQWPKVSPKLKACVDSLSLPAN